MLELVKSDQLDVGPLRYRLAVINAKSKNEKETTTFSNISPNAIEACKVCLNLGGILNI